MADNTAKPIDQIKIGDQITNAVPGKAGTETHTVTNVIVTTTDHDFVDLTITPVTTKATTPQPKTAGLWTKAALGLAASIAAIGLWAATPPQQAQAAEHTTTTTQAQTTTPTTDAQPHGATLTTTYHHPFYDQTQHAFVEAQHLHPGDVLQTPTGTATVADIHLYQANSTTYDLTVGDLHTYYVEAIHFRS